MQLWSGRPKVNAWGENHLWSRYRKGFRLSRGRVHKYPHSLTMIQINPPLLAEPRILNLTVEECQETSLPIASRTPQNKTKVAIATQSRV
jgi:hypothetical protein